MCQSSAGHACTLESGCGNLVVILYVHVHAGKLHVRCWKVCEVCVCEVCVCEVCVCEVCVRMCGLSTNCVGLHCLNFHKYQLFYYHPQMPTIPTIPTNSISLVAKPR